MAEQEKHMARQVLITSANPLFGKGLEKMLRQRSAGFIPEIHMVNSLEETYAQLEEWKPDLVIVDYDDHTIDRAKFLSHFMETHQPLQVMLVSLQASGEVVVYDRKNLTPAQAEEWLSMSAPVRPENPIKLQQPRSDSPVRHFITVGALVLISTVLIYLLLTGTGLLPAEASQQAIVIDQLFNVHFALIAFLFSLIVVFIGYSLVVFRRKGDDGSDGKYFKGNSRLELIWTMVPLITVISLAYVGSQDLATIRHADPQAMVVNVTAFQWNWQFEYPDYGITTDTLYLPINKQVLLKLTSRDVIHSFWVPEFRVKQDALPGANLVKELRVTPIQTGNFKVRCAELCGGAHAAMERPVNVVSQQDFDSWVSSQMASNTQDPVQRGQKVSEINCKACHSFDGSKTIGPTWKSLFGSVVELADGTTVKADEAYMKESIVDPAAKVVKDFPNIMPPTFKNILSDQQISDILAFIESLK